MRILPSVLKELVKHVPTVLFEVTDWNELASELPKLSRKIIKKEGYSELFDLQKSYLSDFNLKLIAKNETNLSDHLSKEIGEQFLCLYFAQLYSPHGIFLDLRSGHFEVSSEEKLLWSPPGLWVKFNDKFRQGLLEVYDGFYLENDNIYCQGLVKAGLMSEDWSQEDKDKLAQLFKAQFGKSLTDEMTFTIEEFKISMTKIADFLLDKKVKISKDFLYLGIYLVTLYSNLEKISKPLAVKKVYLEVRDRIKSTSL